MNPMNKPMNKPMNASINPPMNNRADLRGDWEQHLDDSLLTPPADFTARVMGRISSMPLPALASLSPLPPLPPRSLRSLQSSLRRSRPATRLRKGLQWLALSIAAALGGALGATQLAGFMFGVWAAVAAG